MTYNFTKCRILSRVLSCEFYWTIQKGYTLEQLWKTICVCGFSFTRSKVNNLRNPAKLSLFKKAIYKTRNTGTRNEMWRMLDTRGMFTGAPVNLLEDSREWYHFRILRNVEEDFRECSRRFQEMLAKILVNISKHSGYCSSRSRGMPV